MPPTRAVFVTAWAVTLAALLGVILAGPEPFDQLGELPETALTLPSQVWVTVAVTYYALSTVILYRLARRSPATDTAFLVYVGLMAANETWNYLLFAGDRLGWATVGLVAFAGYAVAVAVVLRRTPDPMVFRLFAPYVVWLLAYDVPWMLLTWNAGR